MKLKDLLINSDILKGKLTFPNALSFLVLIVLALNTFPLLFGGYPAGWDMPGHYNLYIRMTELLRNFDLFAYDPTWFGGYPTFVLYPPFFYIIPALINILTGSFLDPKLIFNLYIFLIPFSLFFALRFAVIKWYGREVLNWFHLLVLCYFFTDVEHAHLSIGLAGYYYIGLPVASLGAVFYLLFLSSLRNINITSSKMVVIRSAALLALIGYTHSLTAVFAAFTFLIYALFNFNLYRKSLLILISSVLLILPWAVQFVSYLPYSSGQPIGLRHDLEGFSDPFFMLFPNLEIHNFQGLFAYHGEAEQLSLSMPFGYRLIFEINPWLSYFPFLGIICLIGALSGLIYGLKNNHKFISWLLLISFMILPRDLLNHIFPIGIHYYRFAQFIFLINVMVSSYGLYSLSLLLQKIQYRRLRIAIKLLLSIFILISVINLSILNLKWDRVNIFGRYASYSPGFKFNLESYDDYEEIEKVIGFFRKEKPQQRVAVETVGAGIFDYGSPHALVSLLPIEAHVETSPGLLAESSISTGFINPLIAAFGNHLAWGRDNLLKDPTFKEMEVSGFISRMELMGFQYIVCASQKLIQALSTEKTRAIRVADFGQFVIFKFSDPAPLALKTSLKPFLFKNLSGTSFREFAEDWFKYDSLLKYPIAYAGDSLSDIKREAEDFSGLILSFYGNKQLTLAEYNYWIGISGKAYFINALPPEEITEEQKRYFFRDFHGSHGKFAEKFATEFESTEITQSEAVFEESRVGGAIKAFKFYSESPIIINYNFDRCWKSPDGSKVYWLSPSRMYLPNPQSGILECDL